MKTKKELKGAGGKLKPTVHIGKDGITAGIIQEIKKQIKMKQLIKVRILPSAGIPREELATRLAEESSSHLVEVRGNTVLLCDKKIFQKT